MICGSVARSPAAPWSPPQSANLVLWVDASDGASITESGGAISQWNDKSGAGNHLTQVTVGQRPTIATAACNGLNTVNFNSTNSQYFDITNGISVASGYTIFSVVKKAATGDKFDIMGKAPTGSGFAYEWYSDDVIYVAPTSGTTYMLSTAVASGTLYHLINVGINVTVAGGHLLTVDGVDKYSSTAVGGGIDTFNYVGFGDGSYCKGNMAEMLVYNVLVTDSAAITSISTQLKNKWATP